MVALLNQPTNHLQSSISTDVFYLISSFKPYATTYSLYFRKETIFTVQDQWYSKVTLRPGARNILAPQPSKTTEYEVKNRIGAKVRKNLMQYITVVILILFR